MQAFQICHIFNRGNNRQKLFFCDDNYKYFLSKIEKHLKPHLHVLAYCLMPNHFHLLVYLKADFKRTAFSKGLAVCLRSYTRGMNKRYNRVGSMFQQHTKIKNISISVDPEYYSFICFNYIHQNPVNADIAKNFSEWTYSSYNEYLSKNSSSICSCELARNLLDLPKEKKAFIKLSDQVVNPDNFPFQKEVLVI